MARDVLLAIASNRLGGVDSSRLKLLVRIGVTALALIIFSAPTVACLWPGSTLTASEHECCRRITKCGQAKVSSHRCCATTVRQDNAAIVQKAASLAPHLSVAAAVTPSPIAAPAHVDAASQHALASHSPPDPYLGSTQILRI
jgi:hypothetical protein